MRDFRDLIQAIEFANICDDEVINVTMQNFEVEPSEFNWEEEIHNLLDKMKSYYELSDNNDFAMGVETGLSMAVAMLERLIRKNGESNNV